MNRSTFANARLRLLALLLVAAFALSTTVAASFAVAEPATTAVVKKGKKCKKGYKNVKGKCRKSKKKAAR